MEASSLHRRQRPWVPRWLEPDAGHPGGLLRVRCPLTRRAVELECCLGCPYYGGLHRPGDGPCAIKCRLPCAAPERRAG